ncbi:MAG: hypothetical protein NTX28_03555, partial [Novosphingobium sp.]|nr:hypothetical protein [Novosphingobium sp.]
MKTARSWIRTAGLLALSTAGLGTALWACADSSCAPGWQVAAGDYDCAGRAMISPGNDTRINLLMLMRSLQPAEDPAPLPQADANDPQFGRAFMSWQGLRSALWPQPQIDDAAGEAAPTCEPAAIATPEFIAAVTAEAALPAAERATLTSLRSTTGCNDGEWQDAAIKTRPGREYLAYLKAADAFHKGDYAAATSGFAALSRAGAKWVAETSVYMPIRIGLRAAIVPAVDEGGDFAGPDKVDKAALAQARGAIEAYVRAYPSGRYAASAIGLKRRVAWLSGDTDALVASYEAMLASTPGSSEAAADLAEE